MSEKTNKRSSFFVIFSFLLAIDSRALRLLAENNLVEKRLIDTLTFGQQLLING
jgi:hypothetical protein